MRDLAPLNCANAGHGRSGSLLNFDAIVGFIFFKNLANNHHQAELCASTLENYLNGRGHLPAGIVGRHKLK